VHALERAALPRVAWRAALLEAPFIDAAAKSLHEPAELSNALAVQEARLPVKRGATVPFGAP
jgi:hypothetical protein